MPTCRSIVLLDLCCKVGMQRVGRSANLSQGEGENCGQEEVCKAIVHVVMCGKSATSFNPANYAMSSIRGHVKPLSLGCQRIAF